MRKKNWIEFKNNNIRSEDSGDKIFTNQTKKLKIYREKKGKKGKTVTIVSGFEQQNTSQIIELLKKLKVYCGTGGSLHCLLYTSPSPRDRVRSRMPSSA